MSYRHPWEGYLGGEGRGGMYALRGPGGGNGRKIWSWGTNPGSAAEPERRESCVPHPHPASPLRESFFSEHIPGPGLEPSESIGS